MKRELIIEAGGFSEDPQLRAMEDFFLWLKIVLNFATILLGKRVSCIFRFNKSIRSEISKENNLKGQIYIIEYFLNTVDTLKDVDRKIIMGLRRSYIY